MDHAPIRRLTRSTLLAMVGILSVGVWIDMPARAGDLTWCDRGHAKMEESAWRQAEKLYDLCIENGGLEAGELAMAHHRLGRALMKQRRLDEATRAMDAALAADADFHPAWNTRAWIALLNGDPQHALEDVREALRLAPDEVRAVDTLAHIQAALGRREEASAEFRRALSLHGMEGVAKYQQALIDAGYDPGPPDGIAGPQTNSALDACAADACILWPLP